MPTGFYERKSLAERFWSNVDKGAGPGDCWGWRGATSRGGYGAIGHGGKVLRAPRVSLSLAGVDPGQGFVCHRCDNPPCCNPEHLYVGTPAQNVTDMVARGRLCRTRKLPRGSAHALAKLDEAKAAVIKSLLKTTLRHKDIAALFSVSTPTIWAISAGRIWKHVEAA